jgi:hypothetical protein
MGGGAPENEHILALLPFKEDSKIIESIKKKHPNVEFTYQEAYYEKGKSIDTHIPDGNSPRLRN